MSFREVRLFVESMRLLGYPQSISVEAFNKVNVELVADCLYWLIKRYDPSVEIVFNIERDVDRVAFFRQIYEIAYTKARLTLNPKKLYRSDAHAVQELLKLTSVLKKALRATEREELDFVGLHESTANKNLQDVKRAQELSTNLTNDGSTLFHAIEDEVNQREERRRILSQATEVGEFERRLRALISNVNQQTIDLKETNENLVTDESNLEQKIERKRTQLERLQKRLNSLLAVRPAFIEEYDKYEAELHSQFVLYLEQYRNLEYLEYKLAQANAIEDARLEEQTNKLNMMRERLRKEEVSSLRDKQREKEAMFMNESNEDDVSTNNPDTQNSSFDDQDSDYDEDKINHSKRVKNPIDASQIVQEIKLRQRQNATPARDNFEFKQSNMNMSEDLPTSILKSQDIQSNNLLNQCNLDGLDVNRGQGLNVNYELLDQNDSASSSSDSIHTSEISNYKDDDETSSSLAESDI